jgi:hypothetical protein
VLQEWERRWSADRPKTVVDTSRLLSLGTRSLRTLE